MTIYETITDRIITQLENGIIPWRKEWKTDGRMPYNFLTGKPYRGINLFTLMYLSHYGSPAWMTYKQALEAGGQVRKGEKGLEIVFWSFPSKKPASDSTPVDDSADSKDFAFAKYYHVFNVEQIDGLQPALPFDAPAFDPIDSAESIVSGYMKSNSHPTLEHGGDRAFFSPSRDHVQMPLRQSFNSPAGYYCTLFHEFAHSTGINSRLSRKMATSNAAFGSEEYSDEELTAEFSAAFLSAEAGISSDALIVNSTAYIQGWLKKLKGDSRAAINAAQRAQKAADYILQRYPAGSSEVCQ